MPLHPAAAHAARQLRAAVRAHIRLATGSRPPLSPDRFGNAHLPHGGEDMAALVVDTRRAFEQLGENDQQLVAALCVEGQPLAVAAARAGISQRTAMRRYPECLSFLAALLWPYA
jgi:DNA-directed RNA polymerase specialized sigma24 family protein